MLALYGLTRFPFSVVSTTIVALVEARIAILRIQNLLLATEVDPDQV